MSIEEIDNNNELRRIISTFYQWALNNLLKERLKRCAAEIGGNQKKILQYNMNELGMQAIDEEKL